MQETDYFEDFGEHGDDDDDEDDDDAPRGGKGSSSGKGAGKGAGKGVAKGVAAPRKDKLMGDLEELALGEEPSSEIEQLSRDVSRLSERQKLALLQTQSPELLGLVAELREIVGELREVGARREWRAGRGEGDGEGGDVDQDVAEYLEVKEQLQLSYSVNVMFYLYMKAQGTSVRAHPVMRQLLELRYAMEKMRVLEGKLGGVEGGRGGGSRVGGGSKVASSSSARGVVGDDEEEEEDDDEEDDEDDEEEDEGEMDEDEERDFEDEQYEQFERTVSECAMRATTVFDHSIPCHAMQCNIRLFGFPVTSPLTAPHIPCHTCFAPSSSHFPLSTPPHPLPHPTLHLTSHSPPQNASSSSSKSKKRQSRDKFNDIGDIGEYDELPSSSSGSGKGRNSKGEEGLLSLLQGKGGMDKNALLRTIQALGGEGGTGTGSGGGGGRGGGLRETDDNLAPLHTRKSLAAGEGGKSKSKQAQPPSDDEDEEEEDEEEEEEEEDSEEEDDIAAFMRAANQKAGKKGDKGKDGKEGKGKGKGKAAYDDFDADYDEGDLSMGGAKGGAEGARRRRPAPDGPMTGGPGDTPEEEEEEEGSDLVDAFARRKKEYLLKKKEHYEPEKRFGGREDALPVSGKRAASYEIMKNRGLTPHRKKENRNPRVKKRHAYEKAIVRRKGQVREVIEGGAAYGGELTGIKANISRGRKIGN